ncbi:MAG: hypothetical protein ACHQ1D_00885 [Nitrososphaerales archaeon]
MVGRKPYPAEKKRRHNLTAKFNDKEYRALKWAASQFRETQTSKGKVQLAPYLRLFALRGIRIAKEKKIVNEKFDRYIEERERRKREIEIAMIRGKPIPEELPEFKE